MNEEVYIFGAGGHGAVLAELADLLGYPIAGFIDDDLRRHGETVIHWKVLGGREKIPAGASLVIAIGDNATRAGLMAMAKASGWKLPTLMHPSAVVSPSAEIGPGTMVMAQVVVNARVHVGAGCILNTASSVDHDCVIGDLVHIAPGVRLSGGIHVGHGTLIGIGSAVCPLVKIGSNCLIGAGSTVVKDIPEGVTAFGSPARVHLKNAS